MAHPLMPAYETLIEQRIRDARARGEFDDLPGAGQPMALDDDLLVPEDVRVAHRILKNAGYVPPEAQQLSEINQLIALAGRAELSTAQDEAMNRRLRALMVQMELAGRPLAAAQAWHDYQEALARRLADVSTEARHDARHDANNDARSDAGSNRGAQPQDNH